MKKTYKIPVSWELGGIIEVEADSLKEALKEFDDNMEEYDLPFGDYIDGSFERDEDDEFIKEYNT